MEALSAAQVQAVQGGGSVGAQAPAASGVNPKGSGESPPPQEGPQGQGWRWGRWVMSGSPLHLRPQVLPSGRRLLAEAQEEFKTQSSETIP